MEPLPDSRSRPRTRPRVRPSAPRARCTGRLRLALLVPLAVGVAAALWTAAGERATTPETGAAPLATRWDAPWSAAPGANSEANSEEGRARVLLYVRADSPTCLTLERAAGADAPLAAAMDAFRPVVLDPEARAADRALVRRLGVTTAPRMLVMDGPTWAAWREAAAGSAPPPVRPLRPITGGHLEPFGLTLELARAAAEDPGSWVPPAAPTP